MSVGLKLLRVIVVSVFASSAPAADWAQWRGPQRTGVSAENGLADQWPQAGPKLVWKSTEIRNGYGSPSISGNRLYVIGSEGVSDEFVFALDIASGRKTWERRIGKVGNPDQQPPYPAARSTPTIDGNRIYAFSSDGDIVCMEEGGRILWQKNVRSEFGGKPVHGPMPNRPWWTETPSFARRADPTRRSSRSTR